MELQHENLETTTRPNFTEINSRGPHHVLCKAYYLPETELNLLLSSRVYFYGVTTIFGLGKWRVRDTDDKHKVRGTLHKKEMGFFKHG